MEKDSLGVAFAGGCLRGDCVRAERVCGSFRRSQNFVQGGNEGNRAVFGGSPRAERTESGVHSDSGRQGTGGRIAQLYAAGSVGSGDQAVSGGRCAKAAVVRRSWAGSV